MTDKTPTSIAANTVNIAGVDMTVHVLDNGQRIIEAESMERFFTALASGEIKPSEDDAMQLANLVHGRVA
jgi:hypothetical protein